MEGLIRVALSLVLLVGAMLFVRTLTNLQRQSLGLDDQKLLVFGLDPSQNGYTGDRLVALYSDLIKRLDGIPGVQSASAARLRLFSGWVSSGAVSIPGITPKRSMNTQSNTVGPEFMKTTGIKVLAGRDIDWSDVDGGRRIALVNEAMATYFFGDLNVLGRRFSFGEKPDPADEYEIIGVVSNAKYSQVRGGFPRTAYIPYSAPKNAIRRMYFHVRATGDPLQIAAYVRSTIRTLDPSLAIIDMDTMHHQVADSLWQERLFARLTAVQRARADARQHRAVRHGPRNTRNAREARSHWAAEYAECAGSLVTPGRGIRGMLGELGHTGPRNTRNAREARSHWAAEYGPRNTRNAREARSHWAAESAECSENLVTQGRGIRGLRAAEYAECAERSPGRGTRRMRGELGHTGPRNARTRRIKTSVHQVVSSGLGTPDMDPRTSD